MKAVLMSIKPKWWEQIKSGKKTIEVRKKPPVKIMSPYNVYVHVSGTKGVAGEFVCNSEYGIGGRHPSAADDDLLKRACLTRKQFDDYSGENQAYGMGISGVKEYARPKTLESFGLKRPPMSWQYVEIQDAAEVK